MVGILECLHELLLINANEKILLNEFGNVNDIHVTRRKRERRSVISKISSYQTESESSRRTIDETNEYMQTIITHRTQGNTKKDATELQISSNQVHSARKVSHFNVSEKMKTSTQQNYVQLNVFNSMRHIYIFRSQRSLWATTP